LWYHGREFNQVSLQFKSGKIISAKCRNAYNCNESAVHWDLVCIQTEDYGGGQIYFDEVLVRRDGRFLLEELRILNPK